MTAPGAAPACMSLRADVVYVAPSGRRCRWLPFTGQQKNVTTYAMFVYVDRAGTGRHREAAAWHDGFVLASGNYRLLRPDWSGSPQ